MGPRHIEMAGPGGFVGTWTPWSGGESIPDIPKYPFFFNGFRWFQGVYTLPSLVNDRAIKKIDHPRWIAPLFWLHTTWKIIVRSRNRASLGREVSKSGDCLVNSMCGLNARKGWSSSERRPFCGKLCEWTCQIFSLVQGFTLFCCFNQHFVASTRPIPTRCEHHSLRSQNGDHPNSR